MSWVKISKDKAPNWDLHVWVSELSKAELTGMLEALFVFGNSNSQDFVRTAGSSGALPGVAIC